MSNPKGTLAEEALTDLFASLDDAAARGLAGRPVSCVKGCAHCCYQLVSIGIAEAILIGEWVARQPDPRAWGRMLFWDALAQMKASKEEWFERHVPCAFLDVEKGECRIYPIRPGACRYHYVRTPPENCALGAADTRTERYDLTETIEHLARLDMTIFRENRCLLGEPTLGTLPHLVIYALAALAKGPDRRFWEKRAGKLMTPQEWTRRYAEKARGQPRDEVIQIGGRP